MKTEHEEQRELVKWFRQTYPKTLIFAIPNGGARDARVGAMLKREGVKRGVSDLFLPYAARGYHGYYLEMKRPGALKDVKPDQVLFLMWCDYARYLAQVFDSAESAIESLKWYLGD